jgi:hypothetical protein
LPRARKKKRTRPQKKTKVAQISEISEGQISIDPQILEKLLDGIALGDLLRLFESWGYKTQENKDITQNIDLFNELRINAISKSQFADLWALKARSTLKNKTWKQFKIVDPLPPTLSVATLNKRLDAVLTSEGLINKYTPHVFELDTHQLHIILEFIDEPLVIEAESPFSYQLIKPITRLSSILDHEKKMIYIEIGDGRNSVNAKNFEHFENILKKALETSFERVRVRPYELKELADKILLKKVVFVCPREISGIEGVDKITVEGDNVANGLRDIASRHEVVIEKIGAWAEILDARDEFLLTIDGRIKKTSLLEPNEKSS